MATGHKQANKKARQRHAKKPKAIKLTVERKTIIVFLLKQNWGPKQISGRLQQRGKEVVYHEAIHQRVFTDKRSGGNLYLHLRRHAKKYRKHNIRSKGIPYSVDIEARPVVVNQVNVWATGKQTS